MVHLTFFMIIDFSVFNASIYITLDNGTNLPFSVYANELLRPDDYEEIAKIALEDPNSIVLVTCENESKDGGYLNRRVVFAKPF